MKAKQPLLCGGEAVSEALRDCACRATVCMNFNDIDYAHCVACGQCGRRCSVVGWSTDENWEMCVRLWNERGWNGPSREERDRLMALRQDFEIEMIGPHPTVIEQQWRGDQPEPPPPTLAERLADYKARKHGFTESEKQ